MRTMKNRWTGWLPALLFVAAGVGCAGKLDVASESNDGEATGSDSGSGGSATGGGTASGGSGGGASTGTGGSGNGSGGESSGTGGGAATGGSGGGTFYPETTFELLRGPAPDQVDLLLVIDNSAGMAEKQRLLSQAVGRLFDQLVNPGDYGHGFRPVDDLHVGIISSSLGGLGGDLCAPDGAAEFDPEQDDRAHLLPGVRSDADLKSFDDLGFLAWDPTGDQPDAESNSDALIADFVSHVESAGDSGCGFEQPLEAWYRFLVDPTPVLQTVVENGVSGPEISSAGEVIVDEQLLEERDAFLRPDSAVVIVMLSDENDCSILDRGIGYLTAMAELEGRQFNLPESTSACEVDPNSPCCRSCGLNESQPPEGCAALGDDPRCQKGRESGTDRLNLRCFDQKRRFGFDLLQPVSRYVQALSRPRVRDTAHCEGTWNDGEQCPLVDNPLFARDARGLSRDPSNVHLTGIVGVPWQDIATDASLDGSSLAFKTARRLAQDDAWDLIVGEPSDDVPPSDPLMVASVDPRGGANPITGGGLAPASSEDPQANSINGHEFDTDQGDLQYACIFPLETPRDCSNGDGICECTASDLQRNKPVCQPPAGGPAETTQYYDKAYPGLRQLEVLRDLGDGSAVASICPKVTEGNSSNAAYGYNPAVDAVVKSLRSSLEPECRKDPLPVDADGRVSCTLLEVGQSIDCGDDGLEEASDTDADGARNDLDTLGVCSGNACNDLTVCAVKQLDGAALDRCQTEVSVEDPGFCYIDSGQDIGNPDLLSDCPSGQKRMLRLVDPHIPEDAFHMLHCEEP